MCLSFSLFLSDKPLAYNSVTLSRFDGNFTAKTLQTIDFITSLLLVFKFVGWECWFIVWEANSVSVTKELIVLWGGAIF